MDRFDETSPWHCAAPSPEPDEADIPEDDELCPVGHAICVGAPSAKQMIAHMKQHMRGCCVCRGETEESLPVLQPISIKVVELNAIEFRSKEVA